MVSEMRLADWRRVWRINHPAIFADGARTWEGVRITWGDLHAEEALGRRAAGAP
jgi:hypothetical protein